MADTSIEWTNKSWNPVAAYYEGKRGWMCSKPSKGCKGCYSERMNLRLGNRLRYTPENVAKVDWRLVNLDEPLGWRKPQMVFVCSMTDLFHKAIPFEWIAAVFGVMMATKHTYQVLTKRPERALEFFEWLSARALANELTQCEEAEQIALENVDACHLQADKAQWPLSNVWIGVSAESQEEADERIPQLLRIPTAVRFLSCEPLLGPVNLRAIHRPKDGGVWDTLRGIDTALQAHLTGKIDWVIAGGESGPDARPMHPLWAESLLDQCRRVGVPFFFKQWGEYGSYTHGDVEADDLLKYKRISLNLDGRYLSDEDDDRKASLMVRIGKARAGRRLAGREWNEYPEAAK